MPWTVSLRSEKARRAKVLGICDPSIELCNIMNRFTMPNKKDRQHAELDTFIEGIDWSRVKWSMFLRLQKICCDWKFHFGGTEPYQRPPARPRIGPARLEDHDPYFRAKET